MPEHPPVDLSVVAPAHDERANVAALVTGIEAALDGAGLEYEIIVVDDTSTDGTARALAEIAATTPRLTPIRLLGHPRRGARSHGQSAALRAGFLAARGRLVATLDADLQNDPADILPLLRRMEETNADLVQGDRTRARCDSWIRRLSSGVGRLARRTLLGDRIRDTGCSLRVMRRDVAVALARPLGFRGMHRFLPLLARELGHTVVEMDVIPFEGQ